MANGILPPLRRWQLSGLAGGRLAQSCWTAGGE